MKFSKIKFFAFENLCTGAIVATRTYTGEFVLLRIFVIENDKIT